MVHTGIGAHAITSWREAKCTVAGAPSVLRPLAAATVFVLSFLMPMKVEERPDSRIADHHKTTTIEDAIIGEHENQMGQASLGVMNVSYTETGS